MSRKTMIYSHKISRPEIDPNCLYGFVLNTSECLTMIAEEDDFLLDGYKIIRNVDLQLCKVTATTKYCTRIMKKEGLLDNLHVFPKVDLTDWRSVFHSLKQLGTFVPVENEQDEDFLIGPIRRINKLSVSIDYFDGTGKWQEPEIIDFKDITCVSFDTRYILTHQKYLKKA